MSFSKEFRQNIVEEVQHAASSPDDKAFNSRRETLRTREGNPRKAQGGVSGSSKETSRAVRQWMQELGSNSGCRTQSKEPSERAEGLCMIIEATTTQKNFVRRNLNQPSLVHQYFLK
jgi:hypothetical protein